MKAVICCKKGHREDIETSSGMNLTFGTIMIEDAVL